MVPSHRLSLLSPTSLLSFLFLAIVVCTISFVPLRTSHDEWWHLKTGQWIEENGLPENEIFTYTAEDIAWHNHEWLAQVGMWKIYSFGESTNLGGIRAVISSKTLFLLIFYLGFALFLARTTGAPAASCLAVAIAVALARRTMYPRPPFISYGMLALVFCMLLAWRDRGLRTRWLWLLAPIFALWANLHGGFMAGLVVGGGFWLDTGFRFALGWWRLEDYAELRRRWLAITAIGIASAVATLATPSGYHLYELAGRVMNDALLEGIIGEMLAPDWRFVWAVDGAIAVLMFAAVRPRSRWGVIGTLLCACAAFCLLQCVAWWTHPAPEVLGATIRWEGWLRPLLLYSLLIVASARSPQRVGLGPLIIVLFFAYQGLHHVRHLPLFGIALAPVVAHALADWTCGIAERWDAMWKTKNVYPSGADLRADLRGKYQKAGQIAAMICVGAIAAFYQLLPEEAVGLVNSDAPMSEKIQVSGLLDRNLFLLRGQDPRFDAVTEPGTELGSYPKVGVDLLLSVQPKGRIFNGGNYAGYLIWRLSPESYKVFTDNRYDIYGGKFIRDETIVLHAFEGDPEEGVPSWRGVVDFWEINTMIVPVKAPIHRVLVEQLGTPSPEWQPIWDGRDGFSIWTKIESDATTVAAPPPG